MIINHNMASLNTYRQLSTNTANTAKSLEKLSSGLRINRAGDDAAGLAISEKMRGQIRGLDQSVRNAQDGISLINTAEGALSESHAILQRMRELSVQAANDTATDTDRAAMQKEVAQLTKEIDRISTNTEFNTKKLLNGNLETAQTAQGTIVNSVVLKSAGTAITQAGSATQTLQSLQDSDGNSLGLRGGDVVKLSGLKNGSAISTTFTIAGTTTTSGLGLEVTADNQAAYALTKGDIVKFDYNGQNYTATISATVAAGAGNLSVQATQLQTDMRTAIGGGNTDLTVVRSAGAGVADDTLGFSSVSGKDVKVTSATMAVAEYQTALTTAATHDTATHLDSLITKVNDMTGGATVVTSAGKLQITGANGTANALSNIKMFVDNRSLFNNKLSSFEETQSAKDTHVDTSLSMHIGANEGQAMKIDVNEMSVRSLALSSVDVSTQQGAGTAMTVISNAIEKVSVERSKLGAFQNRLEHTITNLNTSSENLTAAESRIRDVDMAKEMMQFQKNNILAQAATAMLAQANQQPQGVLQLLR